MSTEEMSEQAREVLRAYRAASSLDELQQARLLAAVKQRIAGGPPQGGGGGGGGSGGSNVARWFAKAASGAMPKAVLAGAFALGSAAWLARSAPHWPSATPPVQAWTPAAVQATAGAAESGAQQEVLTGRPDSVSPTPTQITAESTPGGSAAGSVGAGVASVPPSAPALRPGRVGSRRPVAAAARSTTDPAEAPPSRATSSPEGSGSTASAPAPNETRSQVAPSPPPAVEATAGKTPGSPTQVGGAGIDEEMRLLASAYAQLRAGQPARALATIEQHERRFPSGSLTESREVARVLALCALGRKQDARDEATGFLATHPGSPFTARVRAVCAE